jgi:serine/threonine protein kinase
VNEIQALESVTKDHPNIIQLLDHGVEEYTNSEKKSKEVEYMVLERANGGELFDFIDSLGSFEEPVARYFYK